MVEIVQQILCSTQSNTTAKFDGIKSKKKNQRKKIMSEFKLIVSISSVRWNLS